MAITPTLKLGSAARQLLNVQTLAATGTVIGDAAQIGTKSPGVIYATGADGAKGIKLPKATPGKTYIVVNRDSDNAVLKVWPYDTSTQINAITAAAAISMAAKTRATFVAISATLWVTVPLLPS